MALFQGTAVLVNPFLLFWCSHLYLLSHCSTFIRCRNPVHRSVPSVVRPLECGQLQANPACCLECDIECYTEPGVCQWYCSIWCVGTPVANSVQSAWCTGYNTGDSVRSYAHNQDCQGCFGQRWAYTLVAVRKCFKTPVKKEVLEGQNVLWGKFEN